MGKREEAGGIRKVGPDTRDCWWDPRPETWDSCHRWDPRLETRGPKGRPGARRVDFQNIFCFL